MKTRIEFIVLQEYIEKFYLGGKRYLRITYKEGRKYTADRRSDSINERLRSGHIRIVG